MERIFDDLQTREVGIRNISSLKTVVSAEKTIREMKPFARLLHKTYASYLPVAFPIHYYGMPNGQIIVLFSRFYEIKFDGSGIEFVFALHKEFSYDYENEIIVAKRKTSSQRKIYAEMLDKPDEKIEIIFIKRGINSYGEAFQYLNQEARKMLARA